VLTEVWQIPVDKNTLVPLKNSIDHVKKGLPNTPWSSSGDWCLFRLLDAGAPLAQNSSTRSAECMQQRKNTGCEVFASLAIFEGMATWTASHSIDARRYSVARAEDL
jgi:hypothetical protein